MVKQKFDLQQMKHQKFENGKVVVDQRSTVEFDVKVPDEHELNVCSLRKISKLQVNFIVSVDKQNGKYYMRCFKYDITQIKKPVY